MYILHPYIIIVRKIVYPSYLEEKSYKANPPGNLKWPYKAGDLW